MHCQYINQPIDLPDVASSYRGAETEQQTLELANVQSMTFQTHFAGCMEMYSDAETVAQFLADHAGWFCRCAEPMKTQPFGENGYILVIGRYGSLGYTVEPKMAVILEPPVDGKYYMHSVSIPDEPYLGYDVDYQAVMELREIPLEQAAKGIQESYKKHGLEELPKVITQVEWQLHLKVSVQLPKFVHKLPLSMIRKTGDRVLTEIVRQVSPRLTLKVQKDFHQGHDLPLPPKEGRLFYNISGEEEQEAA